MKLAVAGVVLGIGAALGLTRLIASFLFGVKTWDPTAFLAVPFILFAQSSVTALSESEIANGCPVLHGGQEPPAERHAMRYKEAS